MTNLLKSACFCGCGGSPKSLDSSYLPGHDAKHVSALVAAYKDADGPDWREKRVALANHAADVLSPALWSIFWERIM